MIDPNRIGIFFNDLEEYIRAVVTDQGSDHVEDSVRLTELRQEFIDKLLKGHYRDE